MTQNTATSNNIKSLPKTSGRRLANGRKLAQHGVNAMMEWCNEYGDIYEIPVLPPFKLCVVNDADMVQEVLIAKGRRFEKSYEYKALKRLLGNGLVTSEGEFWKRQRRLIQPAFHRQRLDAMANTMTDCVADFLPNIERGLGQTHDLHEWMMALTMDVVSRTLFHVNSPDERKRISQAITVGNRFANWMVTFPIPVLNNLPVFGLVREFKKADKIINDLIYGIIAERRAAGKSQHNDVLDMLLNARDEETGEGMTDLQLRDEVMTLFVAGHETTAVALSWLWYQIAQEPEVEQKLHEEAMRVLPADGLARLEHLPQLTYTKMVIDEAMRLYPPVWVIGRTPMHDNETVGGYHVPKGMPVELFIYGLHRHPKYWNQPERFLPERFTPEAAAARHKFAYLPFGAGQRMCIGNNFALMEMRLIVATLARRYRFAPIHNQRIETEPLVTMRPKHGIKAVAERW